jgi:hypothetical protein
VIVQSGAQGQIVPVVVKVVVKLVATIVAKPVLRLAQKDVTTTALEAATKGVAVKAVKVVEVVVRATRKAVPIVLPQQLQPLPL